MSRIDELLAIAEANKNKDFLCITCGKQYKGTVSYKCTCGSKLIEITENMPHCPICGSMQVQKISGLNRVVHGATFGILSRTARSQFECKSCGYKF